MAPARRHTQPRVLLDAGVVAAGVITALVVSCSEGPRPAVNRPNDVPGAAAADASASAASSPVQATLVADVAIIQSGATFRLGVLFALQPGWHIGWTNPGQAGEPTEVRFDLPDGFRPGPLRWPVPVRFTQPDRLTGYGYRDRVLLYSDVRASNLDPGHDWRLGADATWLACAQVCVPGRASMELWLPPAVSGTRLVDLMHAPVFNDWSTRLPLDRASPDRPFTARAALDANPGGEPAGPIVSLQWRLEPLDVEWFPFAGTAAVFRQAVVNTDGRVTRISFAPMADPAAPPTRGTGSEGLPPVIDGVIAFEDGAGARRGAELSVRIERRAGS